MHHHVHYDAAFADLLKARTWPHVVVDEAQRAAFGNVSLKNLDFIVYSEAGPNLLVDVKGRKFHRPGRGNGKAWENWITGDDVRSMQVWQGVFGPEFQATLVFAYWLQGSPEEFPFEDASLYRGNYYAFVGIALDEYVALSRERSGRWGTITVPSRAFAEHARPLEHFL
jgi:hypothetical protein